MLSTRTTRPAAHWLSNRSTTLKQRKHLHVSTFTRPRVCDLRNKQRWLSQAQQYPAITQRRSFLTSFLTALPTFLVPPTVFLGLLLTLWAYKCFMTVVFQEKILYMSYMPPLTRSETIEDYTATCRPVQWEEKRIRSLDGTKIALAVGSIQREKATTAEKHVVVCYFQGNGGSVPPRLPLLSNTLKLVEARADESVRYTMVALSYRGYWTSSGRATEPGIKLDAQATLNWVKENYPDASTVLWGQSLGAGVACAAAAERVAKSDGQKVQGLVLETPFTSVKSMLLALYPQKWLPYRYLSPFLRNHWDSEIALRRISEAQPDRRPPVLLVAATRDEVVPEEEAEKLQRVCEEAELNFRRVNVRGALHNEATTRREGQEAVARFVLENG